MVYAPPSVDVTPTLRQRLLHWLLPASCLGCGEPVWEPRDSLGLCPSCRGRLVRWPREQCCAVCGRWLGSAAHPDGYPCGRCRGRPPACGAVVSTWVYQAPVDAVVMGMKFRRLDYLGAQLGRAMAGLHRRELGGCDAVVPVPLYWTRHLSRGFNQAAIIADAVAAELGLPVAKALRRHRPTPHQSRLSREQRLRNLAAAFRVRRPSACRGRRLLLVDDVATTGSTLEAAAAVLRRAGAAAVTALTAGRTPEPADASRFAALAGR